MVKLVNVMSNAKEVVTPETIQSGKLTELDNNAKLADVIQKVNIVIQKVNSIKVRDRGPKSERSMTDEDASRIKFGDLKDKSHKEAAKVLGLSYGQIYSCRGEYTFTHVKEA